MAEGPLSNADTWLMSDVHANNGMLTGTFVRTVLLISSRVNGGQAQYQLHVSLLMFK